MAHLATLAEGIETVEQQSMLHAVGLGREQGYLVARPMPVDNLEAWLREQH